jgi:hypothetical protein
LLLLVIDETKRKRSTNPREALLGAFECSVSDIAAAAAAAAAAAGAGPGTVSASLDRILPVTIDGGGTAPPIFATVTRAVPRQPANGDQASRRPTQIGGEVPQGPGAGPPYRIMLRAEAIEDPSTLSTALRRGRDGGFLSESSETAASSLSSATAYIPGAPRAARASPARHSVAAAARSYARRCAARRFARHSTARLRGEGPTLACASAAQ